MELGKRKRQDDGESKEKRGKQREDDRVNRVETPAPPGDEEVDEFFVLLKRIKVAVEYFQRRNGVRCAEGELAANPPWNPSFEREDFDGDRKDSESKNRNQGLDLNCHPASDG